MKKISFFFILFFLATFLSANQNVLILHSNNQSYQWTESINQGIIKALGLKQNISTEYLDVSRIGKETSFSIMSEFLYKKYTLRDISFDVIISTDDDALDFLLTNRDKIFPGTPVVFCGVNNFIPDRIKGFSGITGVNEEISIKETVDLSLSFYPDRKKILVVSDSSTTGRANYKIAYKELSSYNSAEIIWLNDLEPNALKKELESYKQDEISILYLSYLLTSSGKKYLLNESIKYIKSISNAPIFGCWDFLIDNGCVGGKIVHGESQGAEAAKLALRVLAGEKISKIGFVYDSPNKYIINQIELDKFNPIYNFMNKDILFLNTSADFVNKKRGVAENVYFGYELFENHGSVMLIINPTDGKILDANQAALDFYGYDDMTGVEISEINMLTSKEIEDEMEKAASLHRNFFEFVHKKHDGTAAYVEVFSYPVDMIGTQVLFSIINDVTDQKQIYEANKKMILYVAFVSIVLCAIMALIIIILFVYIRFRKMHQKQVVESEKKFRSLFENIAEGVAIHKLVFNEHKQVTDYIITDINPAYTEHIGFTRENVINKYATELYDTVEAPYMKEFSTVALTGEPYVFETFFAPMEKYFRISVVSPRDNEFATVFEDITQRIKREEELSQKNDELNRFIYTVSHDLKSPLVTISAFTGYLEEDIRDNDPEAQAKDIGYIKNAASKMGRLLDELLELSRIGRKVNPTKNITLQELSSQVIELIAGRIKQNNVSVLVTDKVVIMNGDVDRLLELIQNLVDNAVKFIGTTENPTIEIGAEEREGIVYCFVKDNGIGVDSRYIGKIFGLFEKLEKNSEGVGMGLAISKRIIEVHGGKIFVESAGLGKGTSFYFTFPSMKFVKDS